MPSDIGETKRLAELSRIGSMKSQTPQDAVCDLRNLLGARVSTSEAVREHHSHGESYHPSALPDVVCFPNSTTEISEIMKISAKYGLAVVPFGAGTSLEGQVNALCGGISIDLREMNHILRVSPEDLDVTVEAGVTKVKLDKALENTGLTFFVDPGADCTIGGMAATRASGTTTVRYGTMRDNVLSLKVVLADGTIVNAGTHARKSSAGYDLTALFVGSEGTLGVISEVTLRLHGRPEAVSAAVCSFESLHGAVETVIETIQLAVGVARVELLDHVQIDAINRYSKTNYPVKPTLFFEFHGSNERHVADDLAVVESLASEHHALSFECTTNPDNRERLWAARHAAYYASLALRPGSKGFVTDVCVPISRLAECVVETQKDNATAPFPAPLVGHAGDGNFHLLYVIDANNDEELALAQKLSERLVERALAMGGTCTGEHGIGYGKIKYMEAEHGGALTVMRAIKRALDPDGRMNPGKMITPVTDKPNFGRVR